MRYDIIIKEKNRENPISTSYMGKEMTITELVEFFGLNEPDVEWYKIKEV